MVTSNGHYSVTDLETGESTCPSSWPVFTAQRREAVRRAFVLAKMSLHASHASAESLPADVWSTLAESYKLAFELTEEDVDNLKALHFSTNQCTHDGCVELRSTYGECCRDDVNMSLEVLDKHMADADERQQSLGFASKLLLELAARGDLRHTWRLRAASQAVSHPSVLDLIRSDKNLLNVLHHSAAVPDSDPNRRRDGTLGDVDICDLLE